METNYAWNDISKVEAAPVPIVDPRDGGKVVLRHFMFKSAPIPVGMPKPTKYQIISYYKKMIETQLWADGLVAREDRKPEVHTLRTSRKVSPSLHAKLVEEGADFVILVLAEPRLGATFTEKAEIIK